MFTALKKRYNAPLGYKEILRVGLPLVASMGSSTLMEFTDRLFLSHYSVDAIAAALPASLASLTIMLSFMGLCGYTTVIIAQYTGSKAPKRVGAALWQGIWCALICSLILINMWWLAEPLFELAGHDTAIQTLEVQYFRVLMLGGTFCLLGTALSTFYSGRGKTRLIMIANMLAVVLNIPLDYLLIFGGFGIPSLGIIGAGIATSIGWLFTFIFLSFFIFVKSNEERYGVLSSWRFQPDMFRRLLRFGIPSGVNLFVELIGTTWFIFEIGHLGKTALAASNIAFSINSLVFMPMIGMNMAVAALVGQAMGRGRPLEAECITKSALQLVFAYMVPICLIFISTPGFFIDLFAPGDMTPAEFAPVKSVGVILLYYIAIYSLVDASSITFFGALKGAGDTLGILQLLLIGMVCFLILPIMVMKHFGFVSIHGYWIAFTVYIIFLAGASYVRFKRRKWHTIRVVETSLPPKSTSLHQ